MKQVRKRIKTAAGTSRSGSFLQEVEQLVYLSR